MESKELTIDFGFNLEGIFIIEKNLDYDMHLLQAT